MLLKIQKNAPSESSMVKNDSLGASNHRKALPNPLQIAPETIAFSIHPLPLNV